MVFTEASIPDLSAKVAVVTGANSGIGFETARMLAGNGASVVVACRSVEKGREACRRIEDIHSTADLRVMELDLASLDSIHGFAESFREAFDSLHVLVNNAGVMWLPWSQTDFGFEYQFGVNYLGHFYLTSRLIDTLETTDSSGVVNITSVLHEDAEMDLGRLNSRKDYDRKRAYADSKMAQLMFAKELDKRFKDKGIGSKAVAAHPGYADTKLTKKAASSYAGLIGAKFASIWNKLRGQPPEKGALNTLYAATHPDIEGGELVGPDGRKKLQGSPEVQDCDPRAEDAQMRSDLWEFSEEKLGTIFEL